MTRVLGIAGLLSLSAACFAWSATGHMVVAGIAEPQLTPAAKTEIERLLKVGGTTQTNEFLTSAAWSDDIRNDRPTTGPWHYINYFFRQDSQPAKGHPEPENVVKAIRDLTVVLKDKNKSDLERADALRHIIHFVGDVHQPLHATAMESAATPDGDRGGNDFAILPPAYAAGWSRPPNNLHSLWDGGCGAFERIARPLTEDGRGAIVSLSRTLAAIYPAPAVDTNDPEDWATESFAKARSVAYSIERGTQPSDQYLARGREISSQRVAMAGHRLARLLNQALTP